MLSPTMFGHELLLQCCLSLKSQTIDALLSENMDVADSHYNAFPFQW